MELVFLTFIGRVIYSPVVGNEMSATEGTEKENFPCAAFQSRRCLSLLKMFAFIYPCIYGNIIST